MRYEWGHHGSEAECPHVSVVKGGEPLPDGSFSSYRTGRIEDVFDLRLYGQEDGTPEEQRWLAESQAALEAMVELANVGAKIVAAGITLDDVALLREALDSHVYWQLSEPEHRNSGYVLEEGETPEIREAYELESKLAALQGVTDA